MHFLAGDALKFIGTVETVLKVNYCATGENVLLRILPVSRLARLLSVPLLLACSISAHGWGFVGHRYANGLAVDSLPSELKPLYAANRAWIVQHAGDPDQWRNQNRAEGPKHFIDLDTWGAEVAENYPQDYWTACGLYGKEAVDKNGVVPWRIGEYYGKLIRAFKEKNAKQIIEISTFLGHYVADIHVPFHAIANYDGQLTGQKGLHARFESVMVERQIKPEDLKPQKASIIKHPVATAFQWAKTSMRRSEKALQADREAVAQDKAYGEPYYKIFSAQMRPLALRCLEESGRDLASLWNSAWIAAGRPALPEATDVHAGEPLDKPTHDPDQPTTPKAP